MNTKKDPSFESPYNKKKDPSFDAPFAQGTVGASMGQDWAMAESNFTQGMVGIGMGNDGFGTWGKLFDTPADTKKMPESNFTQPLVAVGIGQDGFGLDGKMFEGHKPVSESNFSNGTEGKSNILLYGLFLAAVAVVMYMLYKRGATAA